MEGSRSNLEIVKTKGFHLDLNVVKYRSKRTFPTLFEVGRGVLVLGSPFTSRVAVFQEGAQVFLCEMSGFGGCNL